MDTPKKYTPFARKKQVLFMLAEEEVTLLNQVASILKTDRSKLIRAALVTHIVKEAGLEHENTQRLVGMLNTPSIRIQSTATPEEVE